ncbi:MAG: hypothetical protein FWG10_09175 [Eubacteriaceae bacterium]|nr:hypothetical protein [Eubacteriaceae bacterium]
MDFYHTQYSELSNSEVNELYRSDTWSGLFLDDKLDALQELENRIAKELGNQPFEVRHENINGAQYGYYSNGQLTVNANLVNTGILRYEDVEGHTREFVLDGVNAQMMDTIIHGNYRAYQDDVINERLEHENQIETVLWRANYDGDMIIENGILYRVQALERTANQQAETQTKMIFEGIEEKYGEDSGYQEYLSSIKINSYENALETAKEIYDDENIQEVLDNYMLTGYQKDRVFDSVVEFTISFSNPTEDVTAGNHEIVSSSLDESSSSYCCSDSNSL